MRDAYLLVCMSKCWMSQTTDVNKFLSSNWVQKARYQTFSLSFGSHIWHMYNQNYSEAEYKQHQWLQFWKQETEFSWFWNKMCHTSRHYQNCNTYILILMPRKYKKSLWLILGMVGKTLQSFQHRKTDRSIMKTYMNVEHLWSHIIVLFSSRDCYNTNKYIKNYSFSWTLLDHMFCCRDLLQLFRGSQFYFMKKFITAMSDKIFQKCILTKIILTLRLSNM